MGSEMCIRDSSLAASYYRMIILSKYGFRLCTIPMKVSPEVEGFRMPKRAQMRGNKMEREKMESVGVISSVPYSINH